MTLDIWAHKYTHKKGAALNMIQTNRAAIVKRLKQEGWANRGGSNHDVFTHPDFSRPAVVPRHRELSKGVARDIARAAGW
ncbi:MAG: type II toxin-antitoxin system HicA family toxin [Hyphomicrobiales bacterium]|nr:MAG: type II toxin-antitoxin system HicA family toxin [Hyphomicrobiales bacterium]